MTATHTLASSEGLTQFWAILCAHEAWRGMTNIQREAVSSGSLESASSRTIAALERRQLVEGGVLTKWGAFVQKVNQLREAT